jgi:hypothetical protein
MMYLAKFSIEFSLPGSIGSPAHLPKELSVVEKITPNDLGE